MRTRPSSISLLIRFFQNWSVAIIDLPLRLEPTKEE